MNIELRVILRMVRMGIVPATFGVVFGIAANLLTPSQLLMALSVGLMVGAIVAILSVLYNMAKHEIENEDEELKINSGKN